MENKQDIPRPTRVGTAAKLVLAAALTLGVLAAVEAAATSGHAAAEVTRGDVNCDGQTNSVDAALVLQRNAGLIGSLACDQAGDVNGDRISNAVDAALILQRSAGLIDFPAKPTATNTRTPTRTPTHTPTETPTPTPTPEPGANYDLAQGITELINQERERLGLNQLTVDPALVSAGNEYAKFLFDNPSLGFDHNLDGLTPTQRAQKYGYQGGWTGEILESAGAELEFARADYFTPEKFLLGWINSPEHYGNIIDPKYRYIGVGCYQGLRKIDAIQIILNICVGNLGRSP